MDEHKHTYKVTIEVEVTDEDLEAAHYLLMGGSEGKMWTGGAEGKMDLDDYPEWVLRGPINNRMHANRSQLRWDKAGYANHPNLRLVETTVFDERTGRMTGAMRPIVVHDPREGTWECEPSPNGVCWYDDRKDPMWDECVFCGNPHERK